jgi:two-component system response regulator YesN
MYKILVVEDEEIMRNGLVTSTDWKSLGFEMAGAACNGEEALDILGKTDVDIVLTDIRMPVMDGLSLAKEIHSRYPKIKTILLSAYSEFEYAKKGIEYSVYGYLLKSDSESEFERYFSTIAEVLDKESQDNSSTKNNKQDGSRIKKTIRDSIEFINNHFQEDITLNDLSIHMNFHPVHISRLFAQETGKTFLEVLTETRIGKAKELLATTNLKIYQVAEAVGYKKSGYFCEVFRKSIGMTPYQFREKS